MTKYKNISFHKNSLFFLDLKEKNYKSLIEGINDLNSLKPTQNEINFFTKYRKSFLEKTLDNMDNDYYEINHEFKQALFYFSLEFILIIKI